MKTLMFATLIGAMILPFSVMQAEAKENVSDIGKLTPYEQLLLDNGSGVKELSNAEKKEYLNDIREFIDSQDWLRN